MYPAGEYDLAGFAVGAVEKSKILSGKDVKPGDVVLDFFAGSGTTGFVANELGRRFILVDQNPESIEVIKERLPKGSFQFVD